MAAVGAFLASGTLAATVSNIALNVALNYALAKITAPKGPTARDIQSEIHQADAKRQRHYGRARISGVVHFWEWANVGGNRRLFKLLAISTGEITGVDQWWLDDKAVTIDGNGYVQGEPYDGRIRLRYRAAAAGARWGGHYTDLHDAFSEWVLATEANGWRGHKLDGVATILADGQAVKPEDAQKIYPRGDIPKVTALVRGSPVYDIANDSYFWSENIAAQIKDYFTNPAHGIASVEDIDLASFRQAVADCAELVPTKTGTRPRYAGGGSYYLAEPAKDVVQRWLDACAGQIRLGVDGKLQLRVGVRRDPTYTIEEEHIVKMRFGRGSGEFEKVTTLVPSYTAPEIGYQTTNADAWEDAAAVARYGESKPKELDVPVVQHHGQARALAKIKLAKINPKWRFELSLRFWGLLLHEEESVYLNLPELGIHNEPFWIDKYEFRPEDTDGVVKVRLLHADLSCFDWTAAEEGEAPAEPTQIESSYSLPPPTNVQISVDTSTGLPRIVLTCDPPTNRTLLTVLYSVSGEDEWFRADVNQREDKGITPTLEDGAEYDLRLGWSESSSLVIAGQLIEGSETRFDNISVVANGQAPAEPVIMSHSQTGGDGGNVVVTFRPALGQNYRRSGVWRGEADFASATLIRWVWDQSAEITITVDDPVGRQKYWLRSENASGVASNPVLIGTY